VAENHEASTAGPLGVVGLLLWPSEVPVTDGHEHPHVIMNHRDLDGGPGVEHGVGDELAGQQRNVGDKVIVVLGYRLFDEVPRQRRGSRLGVKGEVGARRAGEGAEGRFPPDHLPTTHHPLPLLSHRGITPHRAGVGADTRPAAPITQRARVHPCERDDPV
jgi:hypothetical protein